MKQITVNSETMDWNEGMTVRDILNIRGYTFKMLVVKINGKLVKKDQYDSATVPENADVKVIHLMSGG